MTRARLEGADGEERREFASDEPLVLRMWIASELPLPSPRVAVELRDGAGSLLGAHTEPASQLGWDGEPGERQLRFELDRLPVTDGRFQLGVAILDEDGEQHYHRIERAAEFSVAPSRESPGWLRFRGRFVPEQSTLEVR